MLDTKRDPTRRRRSEALRDVGDTPLQPLRVELDGVPRTLYLKLEGHNPAGSMKDRTAFGLVNDLEFRGRLRPGSRVVESTSGNMGVSLAFICQARGYEFVAVVDPKVTPEHLASMRAYGATIEMVSEPDATGNFLAARLAHTQELIRQDPACVPADQYTNPANPRVHFMWTGPEILRQMDGRVDAVLVPTGTGGTLAGIGRYFRLASPDTRVVAVDARGSVIFGGPPGTRRLVGLGSARRSDFITPELYDEHILIGDQEAFDHCRALRAETGLSVGGSSGAVLAACIRYLRANPSAERVVCLCPDGGSNYLSTLYDDAWLLEHGYDVAAPVSATFALPGPGAPAWDEPAAAAPRVREPA
ncbi:MAG: pyridoxal-phosphate dependent enzyme [Longimicrobiaceae bacterium]